MKMIDKAKRIVGLGRKAGRLRMLGASIDEEAVFNNIIAFGSIGAGKTASVIYPVLDAVTSRFKNEDGNRTNAKWGGLVLDPSGSLHEGLIYTMQRNGRDPVEDLVVIQPDSDYCVLEFEEVSTQERFFVDASGENEREADIVLAAAIGSEVVPGSAVGDHNAIRLPNGAMEVLCSGLFNRHKDSVRPEVQASLSRLEFEVAGKSVRWLGWREEEAGRLVRVTNTVKGELQYATGQDGGRITTTKPRRLRLIGVHTINNGLSINLVPRAVSSTEAAGWLFGVPSMRASGDNGYWVQASEKHAAFCIELVRQVEGLLGRECSIRDIHRLAIEEPCLREHMDRLKQAVTEKQAAGAGDIRRHLLDYFEDEWLRLDPKTKGNIQNRVDNLLGDIARNDGLARTFCQPSSVSFKDCLDKGKVVVVVLPSVSSAQSLIGTCLKRAFQAQVLQRNRDGRVNKRRPLLFLGDEYQHFLSADADPKFLSVSRQTRILNLISVPAMSSLLAAGYDAGQINDFVECFGTRVFMQNLDKRTNELAEQMTGSRHGATCFSHLQPFEAVLFNQAAKASKRIARTDLRQEAELYSRPEVIRAASDYYQAYIENRVYHFGHSHLFSPTAHLGRDLRCRDVLRSWYLRER
jgi:hypothetical protein